MLRALLLLVGVGLTGCSTDAESRCQDVCAREAKCAEELDDEQLKIDRDECSEECRRLEKGDEGRVLVDEHIACVVRATSCAEILACP